MSTDPKDLGPSTQMNGRPADSDAHSLTAGNDGPILLLIFTRN
ncbi:MAG TPA: hypothetical protein PLH11_02320 [Gemmobacter sp.]|nr:hypothetical protein [Gemmobacter sp.]